MTKFKTAVLTIMTSLAILIGSAGCSLQTSPEAPVPAETVTVTESPAPAETVTETAPAPAPTPEATEPVPAETALSGDDLFISLLNEAYPYNTFTDENYAWAITLANQVCVTYVEVGNWNDIFVTLGESVSTDSEAEVVGTVIAAGVYAYCPENLDSLLTYLGENSTA